MKLLFLTVMPSPYQRQLFSRLAACDGVELAVRYYTIGAHDREWKEPEFEAHEHALPGKVLRRLGPSAHWNSSIVDEIKSVDADLVVVSDYSAPTAQVAMRWLARNKRPFAFWGEMPGFSQRGKAGAFIRRRLQAPLARANAIVAIGSRAERSYRSLFPELPTFNIPYFCDLSSYREARAKRGAPSKEATTVLFSGQLIHRKGADTLIDAFISIADNLPALRIKLLGSGPEKECLNAKIPDAFRPRIEFLGHKDPTELPELFAAADIFCLPSRHDGWGVVVNEALGAGLPIIATDRVGAALDLVVEGENGFIIPTDNPGALAEALHKLSDGEVRSKMAASALNMADKWDLDEGVKRWRNAASQILTEEAAR